MCATTESVVSAVDHEAGVTLTAFGAASGDRRWRRHLPFAPGRRYPRFGGLVDGTLFLTDGATDVIAVDATDGAVRWRIDLYERVAGAVPDRFLTEPGRSSDWFSPPALATPDTVYVQSSYGLHGLAPADGREDWRLALGDGTDDPLILDDPGGLAVGAQRVWASYGGPTPSIYSIELFDDAPRIDRARAPLDLPGRPVVTSDGRVAVPTQVVWSTDAHRSLAFGAAGETVTWQFPGMASTGPAAFSSLTTDGERVFVCEGHEETERFVTVALDASDGGIHWIERESLADRAISSASPAEFRLANPIVAGDTVLTGYGLSPEGDPGRGTLVARSTADGRVRWRRDLPVAPKDVAVAGDRLYVGDQRNGIVALTRDRAGPAPSSEG